MQISGRQGLPESHILGNLVLIYQFSSITQIEEFTVILHVLDLETLFF